MNERKKERKKEGKKERRKERRKKERKKERKRERRKEGMKEKDALAGPWRRLACPCQVKSAAAAASKHEENWGRVKRQRRWGTHLSPTLRACFQ